MVSLVITTILSGLLFFNILLVGFLLCWFRIPGKFISWNESDEYFFGSRVYSVCVCVCVVSVSCMFITTIDILGNVIILHIHNIYATLLASAY